jgi:hypothetical protein
MISTEKFVGRVLKPRTMFGRFLHFLAAAFCLFFILSAGILFLSEYLGLGKPRASVMTGLFWGSLFALWRQFIPSQKELKAFRAAEEAKERTQRVALLERTAADGDTAAAAALAEIYRSGAGGEQDLHRALHYFDVAGVERASAKRKAAAIREEMAQAEADTERAALEAKEPDALDATCPNCSALLGISSAKCKQCGAVFFVSDDGWKPIPIDPLAVPHASAPSLPMPTAKPVAHLTPAQAEAANRLRTGRNMMLVVVALYAFVLMLGLGTASEVVAVSTIALGMFAAVRISEGLGYSSSDKVVSVVVMAIPLLGFLAVLSLAYKADRRLKQLG